MITYKIHYSSSDSAVSKHIAHQSSTNDIQTTPIVALSPYQNR